MAHDASSPSPPPFEPGPPPFDPIPWERPGTPFLPGLLETIKLFVTSPARAFERMPVNSDFLRPLFYLIIIGWICAWVGFAWNTIFQGTLRSIIPGMAEQQNMEGWQAFMASTAFGVGTLVLFPLIATVIAFIASGIVHLVLMLVGGANHGYFATFRTYCYAAGTSTLAQLIPICGSFIDPVWSIVLAIIGLAIAHRTSQGKAALAVLLPLLLICLCFVGTCVFFASVIGLSGK